MSLVSTKKLQAQFENTTLNCKGANHMYRQHLRIIHNNVKYIVRFKHSCAHNTLLTLYTFNIYTYNAWQEPALYRATHLFFYALSVKTKIFSFIRIVRVSYCAIQLKVYKLVSTFSFHCWWYIFSVSIRYLRRLRVFIYIHICSKSNITCLLDIVCRNIL